MVDGVTVKLPVFLTSPTASFAQVEAQFPIRKITEDDTMYYHVVAALDSATTTRDVLFTCMIKHSFAPCKYDISTIVPIHKGSNPKVSESKNYRPVVLSCLFSKILDNCILIM